MNGRADSSARPFRVPRARATYVASVSTTAAIRPAGFAALASRLSARNPPLRGGWERSLAPLPSRKEAHMGFMDDAKETAETAGRKIQDKWEDTTDAIGDKIDEAKADADVKKAEAERDSVETRNSLKEKMRKS
ncbi:hypothetical protein GCM10017690_31310 [Microbacterium terregens]